MCPNYLEAQMTKLPSTDRELLEDLPAITETLVRLNRTPYAKICFVFARVQGTRVGTALPSRLVRVFQECI